jgi:hypothetical protein
MKKSNILEFIYNISQLSSIYLKLDKSNNKINSVGDSFEDFVAQSFLNFSSKDQTNLEFRSEIFSWLGNKNNPPDLILKDSDAIEIKKIENYSQIALNSSFPKQQLESDDPMITANCRKIDGGNWQKNIYYFIGKVNKDNNIESIFIIDGFLYSANKETYLKIKNVIKNGIESINSVEFAETNEIGKVNRVDPLGITYLRIRGMWGIENPFTVFSYLDEVKKPKTDQFCIYALFSLENFNKFDKESISKIIDCSQKVKVKNPDNPSQLIEAILTKVIK